MYTPLVHDLNNLNLPLLPICSFYLTRGGDSTVGLAARGRSSKYMRDRIIYTVTVILLGGLIARSRQDATCESNEPEVLAMYTRREYVIYIVLGSLDNSGVLFRTEEVLKPHGYDFTVSISSDVQWT